MNPLKIRRDEWPLALSVVLWVSLLQVLMLCKYYGVLFSAGMDEPMLHQAIGQYFHLSGFDAITYRVLTDWGPYYDVVRHPLLPWLLYPLYLLNRLLWWLTGANCAMPLCCLLLTACALYSALLFYRIERHIVGITRADAMLLSWLLCSLAYIMATFIAPDHFALSLLLLLVVCERAGTARTAGTGSTAWGTLLLLTAGVTLTNGAKVLVAQLCARGRAFFKPRHLLTAAVLPLALVLAAAWVQHRVLVLPKEQAQQQYAKAHRAEMRQQAIENRKKYSHAPWVIHKGRPIGYGEPAEGHELAQGVLRWTDTTTPRWDTVVENLLGESMQFHEQHMLEDVLVFYRPVLLAYDGWWHYAVEALLMALCLAGCWIARRTLLLWMLLAWAATDLTMHIGLGFAINEVYIMSAHWIFVIPLVMGYLFLPDADGRLRRVIRGAVAMLTLYLIIYNGVQLVGWLLQPPVLPPFTF